jgi:hypothetical protein
VVELAINLADLVLAAAGARVKSCLTPGYHLQIKGVSQYQGQV